MITNPYNICKYKFDTNDIKALVNNCRKIDIHLISKKYKYIFMYS